MADKEVPLIKAVKTSEKDVILDPAGFFVIEVKENIRVEYYSNVYKNNKIVSGNLQMVFTGKMADAICDTIVNRVPPLLPEHYAYLGRELQKAQNCLVQKKKYIQGGC